MPDAEARFEAWWEKTYRECSERNPEERAQFHLAIGKKFAVEAWMAGRDDGAAQEREANIAAVRGACEVCKGTGEGDLSREIDADGNAVRYECDYCRGPVDAIRARTEVEVGRMEA